MKMGTSLPLTGLMANLPVNTPVFSPSARRSISDSRAALAMYSRASSSCSVPEIRSCTSGCSGASTQNVMPKMVSGRVVNTSNDATKSLIGILNRAPADRPIQFLCMVRTRSGQSSS